MNLKYYLKKNNNFINYNEIANLKLLSSNKYQINKKNFFNRLVCLSVSVFLSKDSITNRIIHYETGLKKNIVFYNSVFFKQNMLQKVNQLYYIDCLFLFENTNFAGQVLSTSHFAFLVNINSIFFSFFYFNSFNYYLNKYIFYYFKSKNILQNKTIIYVLKSVFFNVKPKQLTLKKSLGFFNVNCFLKKNNILKFSIFIKKFRNNFFFFYLKN